MSEVWVEVNQQALAAELERIAATFEAALAGDAPPVRAGEPPAPPAALAAMISAFSLSPFERDVLLLCAGAELDSRIARLCEDGGNAGCPTFGLALAVLADAHWSALAPTSPLRHWRMIEPEPGHSLTRAPLRIDERVLHHLVGVEYLDAQLAPLLAFVPAEVAVSPSHEAAATSLAAAHGLVVLVGADAETRRALAASAHARGGRVVHAISAEDLPPLAADRDTLARRWEREAALGAGVLLVDVEGRVDPAVLAHVAAFADAVQTPVVISASEPPPPGHRAATHVQARRPQPTEQRALWGVALGPRATGLNGTLDALVAQFDLSSPAIDAITRGASAEPGALWEACRARARPRLGGLAEPIDAVAGWDDLVLPARERDILREVSAHVRARRRVHEDWGFAGKSARGLGISALFEGPTGTGKTMAAEVLARDLQLDLYRIDLSQVVSKYIGETERNLRVVFDAAESGAAILLFDEADALFGTRTEVKDSHDRYANIEVSYLLARMESYRGLAILTTNAAAAIDTAFLRRLRFIVHFPFPDEAERTEIWERVFPERTPTTELDHAALGRLNLAGGHIRNIALGAAFLAAKDDVPVRMDHLACAARRECQKLGRPLAESEVTSWR